MRENNMNEPPTTPTPEIRPWIGSPGPYAGVGSRKTPRDVLTLMTVIARALDARGFVLRSGHAPGADLAFEQGATHREIYLPWEDFNGHCFAVRLYRPTPSAYCLAAKYHRAWSRLSASAQALHARNVHQVLGPEVLHTTSRSLFVLCWTPDGATEKTCTDTGGTGQAIRIAVAHKIPVWNLARGDHRALWEKIT